MEIFAESWEAARNRVKAAAEDIYDSLINPELFISLDNVLTPILTFLAQVTDSLGGLTGILPIVITLMNKVYGDKIANTLSDMAVNILNVAGAEQTRARALQQTVAEMAESLNLTAEDDFGTSARIDILKQEIELQGEINQRADGYSEFQMEQIQNEQYILKLLKQKAIAAAEAADAARKVADDSRVNVTENISSRLSQQDAGAVQSVLQRGSDELQNKFNSLVGQAIGDEDATTRFLQSLFDSMQQVQNYRANMQELNQAFATLDPTVEATTQRIVDLGREFGFFGKDEQVTAQRIEEFRQAVSSANDDIRIFDDILRALNVPDDEIDNLHKKFRNLSGAAHEATGDLNAYGTAQQQVSMHVREGIPDLTRWSDVIVRVGSALTQTLVVFQSFQNIKDIITDKDLSTGERVIKILTTISMLLPIVKSMIDRVKESNVAASLSFFGLGSSAAAATPGVSGLAVAVNGLIWPLTVIAAVIGGAVLLIDLFTESAEEARESVERQIETYDKAASALQELEDKLKTNKERLEELEAMESPSLVEQQELEDLRVENELLEAQIAYRRELAKIEANTTANRISNEFDTTVSDLPRYRVDLGALNRESNASWINVINDIMSKDEEVGIQIQNKVHDWSETTERSIEDYQNLLTEVFDTAASLYENDEEKLGKWSIAREALFDEQKKKLMEYMAAHQEAFESIESSYNKMVEFVSQGFINAEEYKDYFSKAQEFLRGMRLDSLMGDENLYNKLFLEPLLSTENFKGILAAAAKGLDGIFSEPIKEDLLKAGVSIDEFTELIQNKLGKAKGVLQQAGAGSSVADIMLGTLSNDEIEVLLSMRTVEGEDLFEFWRRFVDTVNVPLVIQLQFDEFVDSAKEGLRQLAEGGVIDEETLTSLTSQFSDLFNQDNFNALSAWDQAGVLSDYLRQFADPAYFSAIKQSAIDNTRDMFNELNHTVGDSGFKEEIQDIQTQLSELGNPPENAGTSVESSFEGYKGQLEKELQELQEGDNAIEVALELQTEGAEEVLEELNNYEFDPFEITFDEAATDAILAKMGVIQHAADLIGENFQVQVENIQDLANTLPALFENAVQDPLTGIVQLSQEIVNAVSEAAQQEVLADANAQMAKLQNRIAADQLAIDSINAVKDAAIGSAEDTRAAEVLEANTTREQRIAAFKAILQARIKQAIQEDTASSKAASKTVNDQAQVTNAAADNAKKTTTNWGNAANAIAKALTEAFEKAVKAMAVVANSANSIEGIDIEVPEAGEIDTSGVKVEEITVETATFQYDPQDNTYEDSLDEGQRAAQQWADNDFVLTEGINRDALEGWLANEFGQSVATAIMENGLAGGSEVYYQGNTIGEVAQDLSRAANALGLDIGNAMALYGKLADALQSTGNLANSGLPSGSGGGGGEGGSGGSQKGEAGIDPKDAASVVERYHNINRLLKEQKEILDDITNIEKRMVGLRKLDYIDAELAALQAENDLNQQKLDQAQENQQKDLQTLQSVFHDAVLQLSGSGDLLNYEELQEAAVEEYNAFVEWYNANVKDQVLDETQKEFWKAQKKAAEDAYKAQTEALKQYEKTIDTIREVTNTMEEEARKQEDLKLSKLEYSFSMSKDVKDMEKDLITLRQKINKTFSTTLNNAEKDLRNEAEKAEMSMYAATGKVFDGVEFSYPDANQLIKTYAEQMADLQEKLENPDNTAVDREKVIKDIQELNKEVGTTVDELLDFIETLETALPDAMKAIRQEFDKYLTQLEHNVQIMNSVKELMTLQGVSYKTDEGYKYLQEASENILESYTIAGELNKQYAEMYYKNLQELQAQLDAISKDSDEYKILEAARDTALSEYNAAQKAQLEAAQNALQTARDMYVQDVEKAVYDMDMAASNGVGLDLLQTKLNNRLKIQEWYFDRENELYQTATWYNKLQADYDKATTESAKQRIKDLQAEIDLRREGNTLTQYDVDLLNAKYKVLQAELALEEALNQKTTMRLVRDSQGNYNYQYTADADDLYQKQQDLLDANNQWYNLTKEHAQETAQQTLEVWIAYRDGVQQIQSDLSLGEEERAAKIQELTSYTNEMLRLLGEEATLTEADVQQATIYSMVRSSDMAEKLGIDVSTVSKNLGELKEAINTMDGGVQSLLTTSVEDLRKKIGKSVSGAAQEIENNKEQIKYNLSQLGLEVEGITDEELAKIVQKFYDVGIDLRDNLDDKILKELKEAIEKSTTIQDAVENLTEEQIYDIIVRNAEEGGALREAVTTNLNKIRNQLETLGVKNVEEATEAQVVAWAAKLRAAGEPLFGATTTALTSVRDAFNEAGYDINELLAGPLSELQYAFDRTGVTLDSVVNPTIDNFLHEILYSKNATNEFANGWLGQLNSLTPQVEGFGTISTTTLGAIDTAYGKLQDRVDDVTKRTGTDLGSLKDLLDLVAQSNERVRDTGLEVMSMWDYSLSSLMNTVFYYLELAKAIHETVDELKDLMTIGVVTIEKEYVTRYKTEGNPNPRQEDTPTVPSVTPAPAPGPTKVVTPSGSTSSGVSGNNSGTGTGGGGVSGGVTADTTPAVKWYWGIYYSDSCILAGGPFNSQDVAYQAGKSSISSTGLPASVLTIKTSKSMPSIRSGGIQWANQDYQRQQDPGLSSADRTIQETQNVYIPRTRYRVIKDDEKTDHVYSTKEKAQEYIDNLRDQVKVGHIYVVRAETYDTGGYTGIWNDPNNDGKLAFLHQKELVLNADDTENILHAVNIVRDIPDILIRAIEEMLDGNAMVFQGMMGSSLTRSTSIVTPSSEIDQNVHIDATFPGVTSAREIEDAMLSLVDTAAQWSRRSLG